MIRSNNFLSEVINSTEEYSSTNQSHAKKPTELSYKTKHLHHNEADPEFGKN